MFSTPWSLGGLELADQRRHGLAGPGQLVGPQRDAADHGMAAAAEPRAQGADVVPPPPGRPGVDADRDLDALGVPRPGDRVQAARKQQVAEEAGGPRAEVVEPIE